MRIPSPIHELEAGRDYFSINLSMLQIAFEYLNISCPLPCSRSMVFSMKHDPQEKLKNTDPTSRHGGHPTTPNP
jgi:hypothetical protein